MADQSTANPTRKVTAGGLAGAFSAILVWVLNAKANAGIPAEIASAITVVFTFGTSYVVPERD